MARGRGARSRYCLAIQVFEVGSTLGPCGKSPLGVREAITAFGGPSHRRGGSGSAPKRTPQTWMLSVARQRWDVATPTPPRLLAPPESGDCSPHSDSSHRRQRTRDVISGNFSSERKAWRRRSGLARTEVAVRMVERRCARLRLGTYMDADARWRRWPNTRISPGAIPS